MSRVFASFALIAAAALLAGCSSSPLLDSETYSQLFSKKVDLLKAPDWAQASVSGDNVHLTPTKPVPPEDLVTADGRCAPPVAAPPPAAPATPTAARAEASATPATPAAAEANRPVGSVAGDLAGAPMPQGPPPKRVATTGAAPPPDRLQPEGSVAAMPTGQALLGGVALGMTECQVVRRAGTPSNVAIGQNKGQRQVVLSYLEGSWPGIYHFRAGRLREVDAAPGQLAPAATAKGKRKVRRKATRHRATHEAERVYVQ